MVRICVRIVVYKPKFHSTYIGIYIMYVAPPMRMGGQWHV